jgi:starvation-inducible DNA-binding protein
MNNKTVSRLKTTLATSYALALKTQNYHWNVTGPNFKPLHELFGEQYTELAAAIDEIAERIRALGSVVDATFKNFSDGSKISDGDHKLNAEKMLRDLADSHKTLIELLKKGVEIAQSEKDEASADLFITRTEVHEKALWMIESSL